MPHRRIPGHDRDSPLKHWLRENVGLSEPQYREFQQYAHRLKGVAAILGFPDL